ncbi:MULTISPECIES: hypothetical protein [Bacillati]
MARKKDPQEELELALKLREEADKKIAEAKKKLKEEEEKKAVKLAKKLMKTYGTVDFIEIKEKIAQESTSQNSISINRFSSVNLEYIQTLSEDDINYLRSTAERLRNNEFILSQDVIDEIRRRF